MKPQPKKEVAVAGYHRSVRAIFFNASNDALADFQEFGCIESSSSRHALIVDARFDFDEVLEYMEGYG